MTTKEKKEEEKKTSAVWCDAISACLPPSQPAPGTPRYLMRRRGKKGKQRKLTDRKGGVV
jgi:hypothetical protein